MPYFKRSFISNKDEKVDSSYVRKTHATVKTNQWFSALSGGLFLWISSSSWPLNFWILLTDWKQLLVADFTTLSHTCSLNGPANTVLFVAVVSMAFCSLRRVVYMYVNFVESIASQFLLFFNSDRKQLLVVGFATISTSSLDSSRNLSLSFVAVINGFLLAPEVCVNLLESMASQFFHFPGRLKELVVQSIKKMILSRSRAMATPFVTYVVKKL